MSRKAQRRNSRLRAVLRRRYSAGWRPTKWVMSRAFVNSIHDRLLMAPVEKVVSANFDDILVAYGLKTPAWYQMDLMNRLGAGWPARWPSRDVLRLLGRIRRAKPWEDISASHAAMRKAAAELKKMFADMESGTWFPKVINTRSGRWSSNQHNANSVPRQSPKPVNFALPPVTHQRSGGVVTNPPFDIEHIRQTMGITR